MRMAARTMAKIAIFAAGIPFLLLSIVVGITIQITTWLHASPWGAILLFRFTAQQYLSWRNNDHWKKRNRRAILEAAQSYVTLAGDQRRIKNFGQYVLDYDAWEGALQNAFPTVREHWDTICKAAVPSTFPAINEDEPYPIVGAVIPVYRLDFKKEVQPTLESVLKQSYKVSLIVVAFNEDHYDKPEEEQRRRDRLQAIYDYVNTLEESDRNRIVVRERLAGKRGAMADAFEVLIDRLAPKTIHPDGTTTSDLRNLRLLNVDGDTLVNDRALEIGIRAMQQDDKVRAITSNVRVQNREDNLLTELTYQRYRYANDIERGAQSYFYSVTCMSGPFMLMHAEDVASILAVRTEWREQTWGRRRKLVGPGDDRRMTQMLRKRGKGVIYHPDVVVDTECPVTIPRWKLQQTRWTRSAMRGFASEVFAGWFYRNFRLWAIFDEFYLALFGFILAGVMGRFVVDSIMVGFQKGVGAGLGHIGPYLGIIVVMNMLRTVAAMIGNRDWRFWRTFLYLYYMLRYLSPIKLISVFTLDDSSWLSRGETSRMAWWKRAWRLISRRGS